MFTDGQICCIFNSRFVFPVRSIWINFIFTVFFIHKVPILTLDFIMCRLSFRVRFEFILFFKICGHTLKVSNIVGFFLLLERLSYLKNWKGDETHRKKCYLSIFQFVELLNASFDADFSKVKAKRRVPLISHGQFYCPKFRVFLFQFEEQINGILFHILNG